LLKALGDENLANEHQEKFIKGIHGELPKLALPSNNSTPQKV